MARKILRAHRYARAATEPITPPFANIDRMRSMKPQASKM